MSRSPAEVLPGERQGIPLSRDRELLLIGRDVMKPDFSLFSQWSVVLSQSYLFCFGGGVGRLPLK
jgi:hypothetical protein